MSERTDQEAVIEWARWMERSNPEHYWMLRYLHCSLNGVHLSKHQANLAKAAGMLKGIPDLCLPYRTRLYSGLWIEQKVKGRNPTLEQRQFLQFLWEQGFKALVCFGVDDTIQAIETYLKE